jgi:hypothetical protein
MIATGAVATFITSNGTGAAALAGAGVALILLALLGDRLIALKVGAVEIHVAQHLTARAAELDASGDSEGADQLRDEAGRLLQAAYPYAREYEELRRTWRPGEERTSAFYRLVDEARKQGRRNQPSPEAVRRMFREGQEGDRVYALSLMSEFPEAADIDSIIDAISQSRSAFEQYQALEAAEQFLPRLLQEERRRLERAIRDQMGPERYIEPNTDRWPLAQRLLSQLGVHTPNVR